MRKETSARMFTDVVLEGRVAAELVSWQLSASNMAHQWTISSYDHVSIQMISRKMSRSINNLVRMH